MKRSCQRQTQVFDLPVRRMISLVPIPSALKRTISARQTCLCGALRSPASTFRRRRSAGLRVVEIPVRMHQTRMHPVDWESLPGLKCQTRSTRWNMAASPEASKLRPRFALSRLRLAEPHGWLRLSPLTATGWDLNPLPAPPHDLAEHHATLHFKPMNEICVTEMGRAAPLEA